jgi:hypothetical protein
MADTPPPDPATTPPGQGTPPPGWGEHPPEQNASSPDQGTSGGGVPQPPAAPGPGAPNVGRGGQWRVPELPGSRPRSTGAAGSDAARQGRPDGRSPGAAGAPGRSGTPGRSGGAARQLPPFLRRPDRQKNARPDAPGRQDGGEDPGSAGSPAQNATKKAAGKAGKALGNKVAPGVGGKIGEALGSKAAAALISFLPLLIATFFLLPLLLTSGDSLGGFVGPGLTIDTADEAGVAGGEPDVVQRDIPAEYLDAYLEAASQVGVPWPVLAAVGKATTDHGRFSPYDDACPLRDPLGNAARAQQTILARVTALQTQLDAAQADEEAASLKEDSWSRDGGAPPPRPSDLTALDLRLAELVIAQEQLGTSHRQCLRDRDPQRQENLPPGAELLAVPAWDFVPAGTDAGRIVPAPDGFRFDVFWGRWVRDWDDELDGDDRTVFVEPADGDASQPDEIAGYDGPMMLAAGVITNPNRDRRTLTAAVFAVAETLLSIRVELERDLDESLVNWTLDSSHADGVWSQAVDLLPVVTLLDEPSAGCPFDPAGPTASLVEAIWRCELAGRPLYLAYDITVVADGTLVGYRLVPADAAVETLVGEALRVAAGFSGLGEQSCDRSAVTAGVFPLTAAQAAAAGVERCDRVGNITAAARLVAAGESVPPAARTSQGDYGVLLGGWASLGAAAGSAQTQAAFAASGPDAAALSSPACRQAATEWAARTAADPSSPISAAWLAAQPADALDRVRTWGGATFDGGGACGTLSAASASRLARRALATLDSDRMYSAVIADVSPELVALRLALLQEALPDTPAEAPAWGVDSFVPRLSAATLAWPQVEATPSAGLRLGLEPSYFVIPMAVRYGGTVPEDERAGQWLLTAGALWQASTALFGSDDIDALLEALAQMEADPLSGTLSVTELADKAGVDLSAAVRFLAVYRQLAEELGRAPTARELLDDLYQTPVAGANGLICPVDGARAGARPGFINDWQFCRGKNCSRRHEGNDIFAPTGTPIRAVADATVTRVRCVGCGGRGQGWGSYGELGGVTVTYRTENGWEWYNAHLDTVAAGIAPGVKVAKGAIVGTVGRTGNARDSSPHNHLGLFIGGRPTNPFPVTSIACGSR